MKKRKLLIHALFGALLMLFALASCQHARVILPGPNKSLEPEVAENPKKGGKQDKKKTPEKSPENKVGEGAVMEFSQNYYLWGLIPRNFEYEAAKLCPRGIREIYQYSTVTDGLFSEITLGFYMPRTMRISCY